MHKLTHNYILNRKSKNTLKVADTSNVCQNVLFLHQILSLRGMLLTADRIVKMVGYGTGSELKTFFVKCLCATKLWAKGPSGCQRDCGGVWHTPHLSLSLSLSQPNTLTQTMARSSVHTARSPSNAAGCYITLSYQQLQRGSGHAERLQRKPRPPHCWLSIRLTQTGSVM